MIIHKYMNIAELASVMGDVYGLDEAMNFRDALVKRYEGLDTKSIPDREWTALLKKICP